MCEQRNQLQAIKARARELWRQAMNQATTEVLNWTRQNTETV